MRAREDSLQDSPPVYSVEDSETALRIRLSGSFTIQGSQPDLPDISNQISTGRSVIVDGSSIELWDSALILHLKRLRNLVTQKSGVVRLEGFSSSVEALLDRAGENAGGTDLVTETDKEGPIVRLGDWGLTNWKGFSSFCVFLGEMAQSLSRFVRRKAIYQSADFLALLWETTGRAIGIVFLISFLTGLIMAFVGAMQLVQFGADVFIADLVALAMFREMGAMMTGIIIAGRTGSAFAAQIGSMKANDELNALQTMGVSPFDFIVLPRFLALVLMMPILAFLANLSGVFGGLLVATGFFDLTTVQYLDRTSNSLGWGSFLSGTVKSVFFGGIIALTGCYRGMAAGSSAESVGQAATSAVVTSIIWIIIADALFAVVFSIFGI
ncbi:MAG: MlaE family lipid ABC transporter permease subunit [Verrucomicrobiota bacterium]